MLLKCMLLIRHKHPGNAADRLSLVASPLAAAMLLPYASRLSHSSGISVNSAAMRENRSSRKSALAPASKEILLKLSGAFAEAVGAPHLQTGSVVFCNPCSGEQMMSPVPLCGMRGGWFFVPLAVRLCSAAGKHCLWSPRLDPWKARLRKLIQFLAFAGNIFLAETALGCDVSLSQLGPQELALTSSPALAAEPVGTCSYLLFPRLPVASCCACGAEEAREK